MRRLWTWPTVLCLTFGAIAASTITSIAAETHVVGTQQIAWTYNGQKSTPTTALVVDDLKIGDIVEIQIAGAIPHGFVTIRKNGATTVEARDPVLACGEDKNLKPNAVLREVDCAAASKFGVPFKGSMRLEVLDTFKDATDFWCVIHQAGMPGTLKLKQ